MEKTVPGTEYIETVLETIDCEGLTHERLCQLLFAIIDQFCGQEPSQVGPGRRKTYSDSTIVKLDMLMHLTGKQGETEILREAQRHYAAYFEQLPGQGRLWHRIHQALPLIERFRCDLRQRLGVEYEQLRILDTMPIAVALPSSRPGRGNGFDLAEGGYCASKKLSYYGFKLGLLITPQGIPDVYELFSARPHDVQTLDDLLGDAQDILALGDKGFIKDPQRTRLVQEQNVLLITYRRSNQKEQNPPWQQWLLHTFRQRIETVFSQMHDLLHLQDSGAKSDLGLVKRLVGSITAYTLAIYLNALLGRPLLAIKELFA